MASDETYLKTKWMQNFEQKYLRLFGVHTGAI